MTDHASTFAAAFAALFAAHQFADHWLQTRQQSARKGLPSWPGRRACAAHVASYTAAAALAVFAMTTATGGGMSGLRIAAGLAVSAASHYWIDRRTTLASLAEAVGKGEFYRFGAPRPGHDDNPGIGTGAYALDGSAHVLMLFVAALVMA
jgi:hypothetical protein